MLSQFLPLPVICSACHSPSRRQTSNRSPEAFLAVSRICLSHLPPPLLRSGAVWSIHMHKRICMQVRKCTDGYLFLTEGDAVDLNSPVEPDALAVVVAVFVQRETHPPALTGRDDAVGVPVVADHNRA